MHRTLKILIYLFLAMVILVVSYAAYVFLTYYRLEDNLPLEVQHIETEQTLIEGVPQRLLSYNVGFGAYSADYSFFMDGGKESRARSPEAVRENISGAMAAIQGANADFILCQEVDVNGNRSYHINESQLVREALPDYTSVFAQNYDSPYLFWPLTEPHGANRAGQMTFSRYPITSALRRSLPIDQGMMKFVDLDRCYSISRIPVGERELVLYNFHLSAYTADGSIADNQLKMLF